MKKKEKRHGNMTVEPQQKPRTGRWHRVATRPRTDQIMAFRGFANDAVIHVHGRVPGADRSMRIDPLTGRSNDWRNGDVYRVTLHVGSYRHEVSLDTYGFYSARLPASIPAADSEGRLDVTVIVDTAYGTLTSHHRITTPARQPELLIICDLDGTVLPARHAGDFDPLSDPRPLPGAIALCHSLWRGPAHAPRRPLFFISGAPWTAYYPLVDYLDKRALPSAPVLLRRSVAVDAQTSKAHYLEQLLATYPDSQAVLITNCAMHPDSPLHAFLSRHQARFRAIYSAATGAADKTALPRIRIASSSGPFARHALHLGLITPEAMVDVHKAARGDAPSR